MIWFILAVTLLLIGVGMIAVALANGGAEPVSASFPSSSPHC